MKHTRLTFHTHLWGEWWDGFAIPLNDVVVADILREHVRPRGLIAWPARYVPPLYSTLTRCGFDCERLGRRGVVCGPEALDTIATISDWRVGTFRWSEIPSSRERYAEIGDISFEEEAQGVIVPSQLARLTEIGVRFVFYGHDGDIARLYLRLPEGGAAFAEAALMFFLRDGPGPARFKRPRGRRSSLLKEVDFARMDRRIARRLAGYSVDVGVMCAVEDIHVGDELVMLKCWRGHDSPYFAAPRHARHPLISEVNESFEVRYDLQRRRWAVSGITKERCPHRPFPA